MAGGEGHRSPVARAIYGGEAARRVDRARPAVRERNVGELREGLEEVARQQLVRTAVLFKCGIDAAAPVVDGVPAAPEDAVVVAEPVVMELIARIGEPLPL